ncbi:MAG TPA: serine/threonine-protein kinase [Verrucomicrobiae bacterium]
MDTSQRCGRCGVELVEATSSGYCPSCLLRDAFQGLESNPETEGASAASAKPAGAGQRFDNYELLEKIGQGGMGVVYKARQLNLDRIVALKLLPFGQFSNEETVQRFKIEAAAAAGLQHPNIVAIHDVGEEDGQHYFSMDFIEGQTLAEVVREKPLPARRAAGYLKTIAEAVHYAHQHGILHRDLKPSNILIDRSDQPRITDFGLAKRLTVDSDMTLTGQVLGSPNFMAPEQAEGRLHQVGPATEVYSLGALLYHLLTRQPPFQADTLTSLLKQVIETEPVPPRLLNPGVPKDLETICLKCMEKEPARRYQTAKALAEDLDRFLDDKPIQARPVGVAGKGWKWCRRRPALAGMGAALVLVFLLGVGGIIWQWHQAKGNELVALQNAYAADMDLAHRALKEGDLGFTVSLLDKHRPARNSITDLRQWEWRYLWALSRGDEDLRLHQYSAPIGSVAFSKDGTLLAVKEGSDRIGLWNMTTRQPITEFPAVGRKAVAFSPKDNLLAFGNRNARGSTVDLWDTESRKLKSSLERAFPVRALAFSPDGTLLATFDDNGTAEILEWRANRSLTTLTAPPPRRGEAGAVAFSPDGRKLAVGGDYGQMRVFSCADGRVLSIDTQTSDGVTALAFSPDSKILAAGFAYTSGAISLWDPNSGELQGQLTNHGRHVNALTFSPDGQRLASASADRTIRIWSVAARAEVRRLVGHRDEVWALVLAPDGRTLISGCKDGAVWLWDVAATNRVSPHSSLRVSAGFTNLAKAARIGTAFTSDNRGFIATDPDGGLTVWSAETAQPLQPLPLLGTNNWGVALSADDRWLAAGDVTGKIQVWNWKEQRQVTSLDMPFEWCGLLRFSRYGNYLLARLILNNHTNKVAVWRTSGWERVPLAEAQERGIHAFALSPNERHLAAGYADGTVSIWSFPAGQPETSWRPHRAAVMGVTFSPDNRLVVSTSSDGMVRLRDVGAQREVITFRGHNGSAWGVAFSPDGRRLATGGGAQGDAVKLWDMTTRRELLTLPGTGQFFFDLRFSPDGNTLAATSLDGFAHLWRAPSWAEIQAAEKIRHEN